MKVLVQENRIGIEQELNGYHIWCLNDGRECHSWWSSPGNSFGGVEYLQERGYSNITTFEDYKKFGELVTEQLKELKKGVEYGI